MDSPKKTETPAAKPPVTLDDDRPGLDAAGPISPSVPRAGPGIPMNGDVAAILAEAQKALLAGDAQKATDLFKLATDLAKAPPKTA